LQGAGVQFNEIAGTQSIPGFFNGVRIARLRTDIALADFEAHVRNLVSDVENTYWDLYLSYRRLDTAVAGRDRALETWRKVNSRFRTGGDKDVGAQAEARTRQQYFQLRAAAEEALNTLYQTENALRQRLGLATADGRLIRPSDEPTTAKISFNWCESLTEGLCRSVELRQEKWRIKQRELELIASKNFLLPKLDGVALYRWVGLGNTLVGADNTTSNAFGNLIDSNHQEWQLELQLQIPIGFRKEMAGVRNAQLGLARERTLLQEQELELSHLLASTLQDLADHYKVAQTNFNRREAGEAEVRALTSAFDHGEPVLNVLLDAQLRLTEAEVNYYTDIVNYNKAITQVHFRKGSLLEYNGVYLAEGPWPHKAYFDAQRRARARDAALYLNYGFTQPRVQSRGPIQQIVGSPGTSAAPTQPPLVPSDKEVIPPGAPVEKSPDDQQPKSILPGAETGAQLGPQGAGPMDSPLDPRWGSTQVPIGQGYDLGSLNLSALAAPPDRPPVAAQPAAAAGSSSSADALQPAAVQPAAYQDAEGSAGVVHPEASGGQWKSSQSGGNGYESVAHLPAAETDRSTPGWKGL
jgi:outer membrane protein TolC